MRGGKLLAQGEYGCVFDPPLLCRGETATKDSKHRVGKLTTGDDIKNEILVARMFENRPEAKKYLLIADLKTLCKPGPKGEPALHINEQVDADIQKCEKLVSDDIEYLSHYQQDYGGQTLHTITKTIHSSPDSFPFFQFTEHILEVGSYILLHGLIHNDIHSGNILLDKNYRPRLIDFGRSYAANTINENILKDLNGVVYDPSINQESPEMALADGLRYKVPFNNIIKQLRSNKDALKYAQRLFGQSIEQEMKELTDFWKTSKSVQSKDTLGFWKLYWPAVDAWAIGYCLSKLMYIFSVSKTFMSSDEMKKKHSVLKIILCGLLKASPIKRIDCLEALALYDPMNKLVTSPSGRQWLLKKGQRRQNSTPAPHK